MRLMGQQFVLLLSRVEKNHDFFLIKKIGFLKILIRFFYLFDFFIYLIFKNLVYSVIKYLTIRLSGVNTATQVCALCAFVLKNTKLC